MQGWVRGGGHLEQPSPFVTVPWICWRTSKARGRRGREREEGKKEGSREGEGRQGKEEEMEKSLGAQAVVYTALYCAQAGSPNAIQDADVWSW